VARGLLGGGRVALVGRLQQQLVDLLHAGLDLVEQDADLG
jgi:hypothetical protein